MRSRRAVVGLMLSSAVSLAAMSAQAFAQKAKSGRVALVIGNSAYRNVVPLDNPKNDARAVADAFKALGFDVELGIDMTKVQMQDAIRRFGDRLEGAQAAVFYYAGHGLQINGSNYLAAVDTKIASERDIEFEVLDVSQVLHQMEAQRRVNLVFLDACRNNPFAEVLQRSMKGKGRSITIGTGLAPVDAAAGTLISYATKDGTQASDGAGDHSPYTRALLQEINTPGLEVGLMLRRVRERVMNETKDAQVPWDYGSLLGEFYFVPGEKVALAPIPQPQVQPQTDARRGPSGGGSGGAFSVVYLRNARNLTSDLDAVFGPATDRLTRSLRAAGFDNLSVGAEQDGRELAASGQAKGTLANQRYVFLITLSAADNGTHPLNDKIHTYGGTATLRVYDAQEKMFVFDKSTSGNRINNSPEIGASGAVETAAEGLAREIAANFGKFLQ